MIDAIMVLSHRCESDGLSNEYKKRLEKGIELIKKKEDGKIIVCGKNSIDSAKKYLLGGGIKKENILIQIKSRDTIGEAFFTKKDILIPKNWRKITIISSDYHIRYRAALIFDFILGKDFDINYVTVESGRLKDKRTIKEQIRSLYGFINLFQDIDPADDKNIEKRIFTKHKLYSQNIF